MKNLLLAYTTGGTATTIGLLVLGTCINENQGFSSQNAPLLTLHSNNQMHHRGDMSMNMWWGEEKQSQELQQHEQEQEPQLNPVQKLTEQQLEQIVIDTPVGGGLETEDIVVAKTLQEKLTALENLLGQKETEMSDKKNHWHAQKESLISKIKELSSFIVSSEEKEAQALLDAADREEYEDDIDRLNREVDILRNEINKITAVSKLERRKSDALREELDDVNDTLEFDQMKYQKEKIELAQNWENSKYELEKATKQFAEEQQVLQKEKETLKDQLKRYVVKVQDQEQNLRNKNKEYKQGKKGLVTKLEQLANALKTTHGEITSS